MESYAVMPPVFHRLAPAPSQQSLRPSRKDSRPVTANTGSPAMRAGITTSPSAQIVQQLQQQPRPPTSPELSPSVRSPDMSQAAPHDSAPNVHVSRARELIARYQMEQQQKQQK